MNNLFKIFIVVSLLSLGSFSAIAGKKKPITEEVATLWIDRSEVNPQYCWTRPNGETYCPDYDETKTGLIAIPDMP